jgi:hypothetical protein
MRILRLSGLHVFTEVSKLGGFELKDLGGDVRSASFSPLLHIILQTVQLLALAHSGFETCLSSQQATSLRVKDLGPVFRAYCTLPCPKGQPGLLQSTFTTHLLL